MANELNIKLTTKLDKPKSIMQINADIKAIEQKLSTLKLSAKLAIGQSRKQIQEDITQLNKQRKQLYVDLKIRKNELKAQFKAMQKDLNPKINIDTNQAVKRLQSLNTNINSTKNTTVGLAYAIKKALSNAGLVVSAQSVFYAVRRAAKTATEAVKEYDNAIKNLRIITNSDYDTAKDLLSDYASQALDLKVDVSDVEAAAEKILRAGKSVAESNEIIKQSIMLSKTGFISAEEAAENLVVISNAYNLPTSEIEHLNDVLVKLDSETNTTAGALVEAMATSAKNAELCNMSYEDLAATIAKLKNVTSKSENQISTSLNRILNRIYRVKLTPYEVELEDGTTEDVTQQLSDVERMLSNVGVAVRNTKGNFRDFTEIMDDLTKVWDDLDEVSQRSTAFVFGGTQYTNDFINMVKSWGDIRTAAAEAEQATGVVASKYNAYLASIESKTANLSTALKEWWNNVIPVDFLSNMIDATTGVVKFADATRLLQTILKSVLFYGMAKGFIAVKNSLVGTVTNLSNFGTAMTLSRQQTKMTSQQMANFANVCKGLSAKQLMLVLSTNNLTMAEKQQIIMSSNLTIEEKRQMLATVAVSGANTEAAATTISFSSAMKGLWATIKANPLGFIVTLISMLTTGISYFNDKRDEEIDKAREAAQAYEQETDSLENLRQEYLNIVDSNETEAKKNEQLIEWKKKLVKAYRDEKDAIDGVTTARETGLAVVDKEQYYNALDLIKKNQKEYEKAQKALETNLFSYTASSSMYTSLEEKYKDELKELGINISSSHSGSISNGNYQSTIKIDFDTKSAEEAKRKVLDALNWLDEQENGGDGRLRIPLEEAYKKISENIEKYSTIYNEQISAYAQKYLYEFTQTAEGALSQVVDSGSFQKWKDKVLKMAEDSEPLKNALVELADEKFPEYSEAVDDSANSQNSNTLSVKKLTDAYEDLSEVLDDLFSKQDKLAGLYEKIAKNIELSASEARELIELFPELTNHLVRVGSKWSFDIKGVNEAFDKLEDDFVEKAQETIDNNKKIIEQSFEDYYAENTKLNFDDYLKENEVDTSDTNSLDYRTALVEYDIKLQKERNALLESYEERQANANSEIEKAIAFQQLLNNQINDFDFDVDNYNDKIKELMDASEKMVEGEALSYDELTSLIDKFPDLTYSGKNGEYFIEKSALDELIEKSYEERNARIDDEIAKTYAVNEEVANRIKAYEDEKERIENAIKENRKKYDESYNNPDFADGIDGILERIELNAERTKLINELNALDKEQYEADKALMESQDKYSEAYRKYLEALKGELTGKSKDKAISNELQNQIDYYKTIISAIEIMRDKYSEAFKKKKEALENEKKALQDGKDALKEANDERQRELDLIEARNNLENAKKRKVWVYSEGNGFKQVQDKGAVKEAEEKYRDAITDIQEAEIDKKIAEIDKKIEANEKQQEAFEKSLEDMTKLEQNIEDAKTVEQAKTALGLADEKDLLNLSDAVKEGIKNGLAEAIIEKDNEENKDNTYYKPADLNDVLKSLGATVTAEELKSMKSELPTEAVYNAAVKGFADSLKDFSKEAVQNVTNNNNGMVVSPTFNIYDASDPNKVAEVVNSEITNLLTRYNNSIK